MSGKKTRGPALPALLGLLGLLGTAACGDSRTGAPGVWDHLLTPGPGEFRQVSSFDTTGGNRDRHEIAPGDSAVLLDVQGPGVIRRIWITVASSDPHYLRRIALKMYWDGEEEPSVAVPLGDFFGNGFSKEHYTALPMGVSSGGFYAYLPMPFRSRARIVAVNGTGGVVGAFYFVAGVETGIRLPDPLATFHAAWHRDARTTRPTPHTVLETVGTGHLAGVSLNAESYSGSYGFLEGDERFIVDGEFRGQGTGTEDYFNGGWYFEDGPFAAPYHGVILLNGELGRIAAYRWHLPDPVAFRDSIRVELEHGHANESVADYATVAYWYQTEPHRPLPPLPAPGQRRVLDVKIPPGAVLADSLEVVRGEGGARTAVVPVPRPDRYDILLYPRGEDGRAREPVEWGEVTALGTSVDLRLAPGEPLPAAVHPDPVRRWAREWRISGPFPNPRRLGTEYSPALDSVWGPEEGGRLEEGRPVDADPSGYVRLNPHVQPSDWVAVYGESFLFSPESRKGALLLGADDAHELWLNGEKVSERQGRNISHPDDLEIPVELRAGWNHVLLKVADLDGGWGFHLRAADPRGDLRWSRDPEASPPPGPDS